MWPIRRPAAATNKEPASGPRSGPENCRDRPSHVLEKGNAVHVRAHEPLFHLESVGHSSGLGADSSPAATTAPRSAAGRDTTAIGWWSGYIICDSRKPIPGRSKSTVPDAGLRETAVTTESGSSASVLAEYWSFNLIVSSSEYSSSTLAAVMTFPFASR